MNNFTYYTPTRVIFGKDGESRTGELIREAGGTKALLHYGRGSAERSGLLGRIRASLSEAKISWAELGGVAPNPRLSLVREGIALCRRERVDLILAVGGGSVIDSAKAIGYGVCDDGDVWDFFDFKRRPKGCLPIGAVLTIAAAGSEMSSSCVITNDVTWEKRGCKSDACRPRFAVINPALTLTLPPFQTACGCADILMHTLERYLNRGENMELTDGIAEALMRTVIQNARILLREPENENARAEIAWAGSLSHNGLTGCGTDGGDWATHKMEHELGAMFDVAHGAGLTALWGSWARYVYRDGQGRFVKLATRVMDVEPKETPELTALAGITAVEEFFRELGLPVSLAELGINPTKEQIALLADKCLLSVQGKTGSVRQLGREDILAVYRAAVS